MRTAFLPGTVTRSSGLWPWTSALGLMTRNSSAGMTKFEPSSKLTVSSLRALSTLSSVGQGSRSAIFMVLAQIDLAFDHVIEARSRGRQYGLHLECALAGQALLANQILDRLLRGDADFLQELSHRHVEAWVFHLGSPCAG